MKEYGVPEDLIDVMETAVAAEACRDKIIRFPFCFKKALKYSKLHTNKKQEFWRGIKELYPELETKNLNYNIQTQVLTVLNNNDTA